MSAVRLDAATLEWVAEQLRQAADSPDPDAWRYAGALLGSAKALMRHAAEARSRPPAFSDWIRATEGTALGEPLLWWDDGVEGDLDLAACWQPAAGRRVVAYLGPQGARYVEVDGKVYEWCLTPAGLRAALEALAVPS